jgi:hypothetical protein
MAQEIITGAMTLKKIEKALKENYLPVWRNGLTIEPSPLLGKIKKVTLKSDKIVATAPIGLSGGFGFGAEGQATPIAGNVMHERFETRAKDMYVNIAISAKAVRLSGSTGSMVNALNTEVTAAYDTAKWNVGRSLFGNGTGILSTSEAVANNNVIKVADTKFLKEGLIIDVYATGESLPQEKGKGVRIISVDRVKKTITIGGDAVTLDAGFITVQNSYNREITGLGAIFDEGITTLYGVNKADNAYIKPTEIDASGNIDDGILWDAVENAETYKNSKIDTMLLGRSAYKSYIDYLRTNNINIDIKTKDIVGGFKSLAYAFGTREIDMVYEQFIPDDEVWCIESGALELHTQEWDFADLQGGGIFNLMENSSIYRALLANYGNLICNNPGGLVRITNCA